MRLQELNLGTTSRDRLHDPHYDDDGDDGDVDNEGRASGHVTWFIDYSNPGVSYHINPETQVKINTFGNLH